MLSRVGRGHVVKLASAAAAQAQECQTVLPLPCLCPVLEYPTGSGSGSGSSSADSSTKAQHHQQQEPGTSAPKRRRKARRTENDNAGVEESSAFSLRFLPARTTEVHKVVTPRRPTSRGLLSLAYSPAKSVRHHPPLRDVRRLATSSAATAAAPAPALESEQQLSRDDLSHGHGRAPKPATVHQERRAQQRAGWEGASEPPRSSLAKVNALARSRMQGSRACPDGEEPGEDAAWTGPQVADGEIPVPESHAEELYLVLDIMRDILRSAPCYENLAILREAHQIAHRAFFDHPEHLASSPADREAALFVGGRLAEGYLHMHWRAEMTGQQDGLDNALQLLKFTLERIGPVPLKRFHSLVACLGRQGRWQALLQVFNASLAHHGGSTDEYMLYSRLRALIARDDWKRVERYWEQYGSFAQPVQPPRSVFHLLLRVYLQRQDISSANEVLSAMVRHGHPVTVGTWLVILRAHTSKLPGAEVGAALRRQTLEVQADVRILNELLRQHASEANVRAIMQAFRHFSINTDSRRLVQYPHDDVHSLPLAHPPKPDIETYTIMVQLFGQLGYPKEALRFYRLVEDMWIEAEAMGEQGAAAAGGSPEMGIGGQSERSLVLQESSSSPSCKPKTCRDLRLEQLQRAASGVIDAFNTDGQPEAGLQFARAAMHGQPATTVDQTDSNRPCPTISVGPSTQIYKAMLSCATTMRDAGSAREILVDMFSRGLRYNGKIRRALASLVMATVDKDTDDARTFFRRLIPRLRGRQAGPGPYYDRPSVDRKRRLSLIETLDQMGLGHKIDLVKPRPRQVLRVQEQSHAWVKDTSMAPYDRNESAQELGGAHGPSTTDSSAERTSDSTTGPTAFGQRLTPFGYALRLRVLAVIRQDFAAAEAVYRSMLVSHVRPTMMHIAPLIEGLASSGRLQAAQALKRRAHRILGLAPNLHIHKALIRAYAYIGDEKGAQAEMVEMRDAGIEPDAALHNILRNASVRRIGMGDAHARRLSRRPPSRAQGRAQGRAQWQEDDTDLPLPALDDVHGVTTLFRSFMARGRYLAAQRLYAEALAAGIRPDAVLRKIVQRSGNYISKALERAKLDADGSSTAPASASARAPTSTWTQSSAQAPAQALDTDDSFASFDPIATRLADLTEAHRLQKLNFRRTGRHKTGVNRVKKKEARELRKEVVVLAVQLAEGRLEREGRERARAREEAEREQASPESAEERDGA